MQSPNSYYSYTAAISFWKQTSSGNGYTDDDDWMRLLWIKVSGYSAQATGRILEISGVTSGESTKFEVYSHGSSTPASITGA